MIKKTRVGVRFVMVAVMAIWFGFPSAGSAETVRLDESFGKLPLYFVENRGQTDSRVSYYLQGRDAAVYFTPLGLKFALIGPGAEPGRWAVGLDFVGARKDLRVEGSVRTEAVVSYFKGPKDQWKTGIPTYSEVIYRSAWAGIDLKYGGTDRRLEGTFVLEPGADPRRIRLAYHGASSVKLTEDGGLEVLTPAGGFQEGRPVAYQEADGKRREVAVRYALRRTGKAFEYGFTLGRYDRARPLVIDPVVLIYCGYIGGSSEDEGCAIAVDAAGSAYVTGYTRSGQATFPVTVGPDLTQNSFIQDAFVAKVKADGTGLVYCGYIGGGGYDYGYGIAVDAAGSAYVTGYTDSDQATFPVTVGPDLTFNTISPHTDAFIAKVKPDGTGLVYCGYIGGGLDDKAYGIAVDAAGNAYVTGYTNSKDTFPVTVGPDLTFNGVLGDYDAFVAKVKADGTGLAYCGYVGGSSWEYGNAIAVDSLGCAYVTGYTFSDQNTFPVTVGPDLSFNGGYDAFVVKVKADGTGLDYCGYVGGTGADYGYGVAVNAVGDAYVTGYTDSTEATFPVTVGPDLTFSGVADAFVAKVKADGTGLVYSGYIGGSGDDRAYGISVDSAGNAYVTGYTVSDQTTFPVLDGPSLTFNGSQDTFVAKVEADGTSLVYCGYIGGTGADYGYGVAVDAAGNAYVVGYTVSDQATFPVAVGPYLTYNGGNYDAFVAKVGEGGSTGCNGTPVEITGLKAVKQTANHDNIDMSWDIDPAAKGYNIWYVTQATDIDSARQISCPPAVGVGGCSVPSQASSNACTDTGGVSRNQPTKFFYQVRTYCDANTEGP